ncbi:MAG: hypothetical protein GWN18_03150, partial [Thermoplasmata archaeon]|nr:hypothetical protein [Thermoplasmata archaeon]NIS11022.1 hypothetical protein [Thermoplasmata archaeon]NIS18954.1 hypothetical protein [Thermoplasmata archaeon]NIT76003.1 hypothetical protein [Thermoplasmata archaeon]NIU48104.1 hypothetical protein [Thermoplasmata archaeon]
KTDTTITLSGSAYTDFTMPSGLVLWHDAQEITGKSDGDTVTSWADESGNGWTLSEA